MRTQYFMIYYVIACDHLIFFFVLYQVSQHTAYKEAEISRSYYVILVIADVGALLWYILSIFHCGVLKLYFGAQEIQESDVTRSAIGTGEGDRMLIIHCNGGQVVTGVVVSEIFQNVIF